MRPFTLLFLLVSSLAFADPVTLKIGSLAPRESPWGVVLRTWVKAVHEKTHGEVEIEVFWNATQGDEAAQLSKLKTGQLDGAVVSATGLAVVDPTVNVLQVPGLIDSWAKLDAVRDALTPRFQASFKARGFVLVGWGDIGLDRWLSKGFALAAPTDLKDKRPWVWRDDVLLPSLFQAAGVTAVPLGVPEVLPELTTGNVNAMSISALAAEQLQWSGRLDHMSLAVVAPNIGGMLLTQKKLDTLSEQNRAIVLETGALTCKALTTRIRNEDDKAFARLKEKMTVVTSTPEQTAAWRTLYRETRARLAKGALPADLMDEVEKLKP
ncbi:MAG: TRAP transporter substrate-binding protein DctP [Myxococcus sp.]|nr:TRAP transporter substrate-binding protein DctP [Myxococcus sp.]